MHHEFRGNSARSVQLTRKFTNASVHCASNDILIDSTICREIRRDLKKKELHQRDFRCLANFEIHRALGQSRRATVPELPGKASETPETPSFCRSITGHCLLLLLLLILLFVLLHLRYSLACSHRWPPCALIPSLTVLPLHLLSPCTDIKALSHREKIAAHQLLEKLSPFSFSFSSS